MPPHYRITTDCVTVSGDYRKHYSLIIILLILIILLCNILKTKIKNHTLSSMVNLNPISINKLN